MSTYDTNKSVVGVVVVVVTIKYVEYMSCHTYISMYLTPVHTIFTVLVLHIHRHYNNDNYLIYILESTPIIMFYTGA